MSETKKHKIIEAAPAPVTENGADDLLILHPNQTKKIGGINVTVREYSWVEGLKLRPLIQPLLLDLEKIMDTGRVPDSDEIRIVLGTHADLIQQLIAQAADLDIEFLSTLNQPDGELLETMWWGCNGPFFMRTIVKKAASHRLVERLRAGQTFTQSLSPAATTQSG